MREIKFRAWFKKEKRWLHGYKPGKEGCNINGEVIYTGNWLKEVTVAELNDVVIEQFTGLLDKNGKEIYEGDIIRGKRKEYGMNVDGWGRDLPPRCPLCNPEPPPKEVSDIYIVEYKGAAFFLQRQPVLGKFAFDYNDSIEVIGTIHENPELLK